MDKVLEKIIADIAKENNIEQSEVELILISPYKYMRDIITKLEIRGKTYDELEGIKSNFNMPGLFKLYLNEYRLNHINKKKEDDELQEIEGSADV